jgi:phosphoenolpyruvate carboxylase
MTPSLSLTLAARQDALFEAVVRSHTEIVLTAHPTQVNRRTLQ